jgi:hypothetical protein
VREGALVWREVVLVSVRVIPLVRGLILPYLEEFLHLGQRILQLGRNTSQEGSICVRGGCSTGGSSSSSSIATILLPGPSFLVAWPSFLPRGRVIC